MSALGSINSATDLVLSANVSTAGAAVGDALVTSDGVIFTPSKTVSSHWSVGGNLSVTGTAAVTGTATLKGVLNVSGSTTILGDVNCLSGMVVSGNPMDSIFVDIVGTGSGTEYFFQGRTAAGVKMIFGNDSEGPLLVLGSGSENNPRVRLNSSASSATQGPSFDFYRGGVYQWQWGVDSNNPAGANGIWYYSVPTGDYRLSLSQAGLLILNQGNSDTSVITPVLSLQRTSSNTPAAGFGSRVAFKLKSSTTTNRDAGGLSYEWEAATEGSQISLGRLSAYYITTEREVMQWGATSSKPKIAFLGATAAIQQTGGAATAGLVYTATEQGMLQAAYDALRTFGFLS